MIRRLEAVIGQEDVEEEEEEKHRLKEISGDPQGQRERLRQVTEVR